MELFIVDVVLGLVVIALRMFSVISVCIRKADVWLLLLICRRNSIYERRI